MSLLPLKFARTFHAKNKHINPINIIQTEGNLQVNKICTIFMKISNIRKSDRFPIFVCNLKYAILSLK